MSGDFIDTLVIALIVAFVVELVVAVWCSRQVRAMYAHRRKESILFKKLVARETRIAVAGVVIGVVAVWSIANFVWPPVVDGVEQQGFVVPGIPRPWGIVTIVLCFMALFWGPIDTYRQLRAIQGRNGGDEA